MTSPPAGVPDDHDVRPVNQAAEPRRGRRPVFLAAAIAAAVGVGVFIGYVVFATSIGFANDQSDVGAEEHLNHACATVERLSHTYSAADDLGAIGEEPWFFEALAAGALVTAAAHDAEYEHLEGLGEQGQAAVSRIDFDQWNTFTDELLVECES